MKRTYLLLGLILLIGLSAVSFYGCAAAGTTLSSGSVGLTFGAAVSGLSGRFEAPEVLYSVSKAAGDQADPSYNHCNWWYKDMLQTPATYVVGTSDMRLLTTNNYNDSNACQADITAAGYTADSPYRLDMTAGTVTIQPYGVPQPGTYTHMGITLIYLEQSVLGNFSTTNPNAATENKLIRIYASNSRPTVNGTLIPSTIQGGDVLIYDNGVWNWIKTDMTLSPITSARPGGTASGYDFPELTAAQRETGVEVLQNMFWSVRTTNTFASAWCAMFQTQATNFAANNYVTKEVNQLPSSLVMSEGHTYTMTTTFNVAQNADLYMADIPAANGAGTFFWEDVTQDGVFKPFLTYALGGDRGDGVHGDSEWFILPPTVTPTFN